MWDWRSDPEAPWWVKLRRARLHIDEVHQRVRALDASNPWSVEKEPAEDPDSWAFRFRIQRPIPADLCAAVGDAIANMRSALDYVAYELAVRHTGTLLPVRRWPRRSRSARTGKRSRSFHCGALGASPRGDFR
jgi:hypothetical protein